MRYLVKNADGELGFDSMTLLREMYERGMVEPSDQVRAEDSQIWRRAEAIPELRAALKDKDDASFRTFVVALFGLATLAYQIFAKKSWLGALGALEGTAALYAWLIWRNWRLAIALAVPVIGMFYLLFAAFGRKRKQTRFDLRRPLA